MRIILITSKLNFETAGGSVMDLHLKAKGLKDLGHDVVVVTAFSNANIINQELPYAVKEEYINSVGLLGIQYGVYHIIKKYEAHADVFYIDGHIFLYGAGLYRLFGGKVPIVAFFNVRLNCWADMQDNIVASGLKKLKKKFRVFLEHRIGVPIANKLDAFIFNTPHVAKLYHDFGFHKKKTSIIEDFVNTEDIIKQNNINDQSTATIIIFCTGRMIKEKGFDLVIDAFLKLNHKENCRVIMSGSGPDEARLRKLVKDLGFEQYFEFPGWVDKDKLSNFFRNADIFIFPKWWIEYGSALLTEAMAFGMPCIIPSGGALEWLTKNSALVFKPDDVNDLSYKMQKLIENKELRVNLSKKALSRARELDYRILSKQLEGIISV